MRRQNEGMIFKLGIDLFQTTEYHHVRIEIERALELRYRNKFKENGLTAVFISMMSCVGMIIEFGIPAASASMTLVKEVVVISDLLVNQSDYKFIAGLGQG